MAVFIIADIKINKRDQYDKYLTEVPKIVGKYGVEYLARRDNYSILEGQ